MFLGFWQKHSLGIVKAFLQTQWIYKSNKSMQMHPKCLNGHNELWIYPTLPMYLSMHACAFMHWCSTSNGGTHSPMVHFFSALLKGPWWDGSGVGRESSPSSVSLRVITNRLPVVFDHLLSLSPSLRDRDLFSVASCPEKNVKQPYCSPDLTTLRAMCHCLRPGQRWKGGFGSLSNSLEFSIKEHLVCFFST